MLVWSSKKLKNRQMDMDWMVLNHKQNIVILFESAPKLIIFNYKN